MNERAFSIQSRQTIRGANSNPRMDEFKTAYSNNLKVKELNVTWFPKVKPDNNLLADNYGKKHPQMSGERPAGKRMFAKEFNQANLNVQNRKEINQAHPTKEKNLLHYRKLNTPQTDLDVNSSYILTNQFNKVKPTLNISQDKKVTREQLADSKIEWQPRFDKKKLDETKQLNPINKGEIFNRVKHLKHNKELGRANSLSRNYSDANEQIINKHTNPEKSKLNMLKELNQKSVMKEIIEKNNLRYSINKSKVLKLQNVREELDKIKQNKDTKFTIGQKIKQIAQMNKYESKYSNKPEVIKNDLEANKVNSRLDKKKRENQALSKLMEKVNKKDLKDKQKIIKTNILNNKIKRVEHGYEISHITNKLRIQLARLVAGNLFSRAKYKDGRKYITGAQLVHALPSAKNQPTEIKSILAIFADTKRPDISFEKSKVILAKNKEFSSAEQAAKTMENATLYYPAVIGKPYKGEISEEYVAENVIGAASRKVLK